MGYRRPPPRFQPGVLTMQDAQALNEAMDALYRLVGGFTATPPLEVDEGSGGVCYRFKGPLGSSLTQLPWAKITGPSLTDPAIYDAVLETPTPNQLRFTSTGTKIWAWLVERSLIGTYPMLTNGMTYPSLGQNGTFFALDFNSGVEETRPLYMVIGGWVYGGGQCTVGNLGITLNTY